MIGASARPSRPPSPGEPPAREPPPGEPRPGEPRPGEPRPARPRPGETGPSPAQRTDGPAEPDALAVPSATSASAAPAEARAVLAWRLAGCVPLAAAVILLTAVPSARFPGWQWVSLGLTLLVVAAAGPVYRAAGHDLRHARMTADVLGSLSLTASVLWSVQALLAGQAGQQRLREPVPLRFVLVSPGTLYLEVAVSLATALLAGHYLRARAAGRPGAAAAPLAADRVAALLVPCVLSVAAATLGFWLGAGLPGPAAAGPAFAVLVLACPAPLGLAAPAAWLAARARAAGLGIEVRQPPALGARIHAVVLAVPAAGQPVTAAEVTRLRAAGLRVGLLTPGSRPAALAAAAALGVPADSVFGGVQPEHQAGVIRELQAAGFGVAFAGDGGTDAAGLTQADLGIAVRPGPGDGPADLVLPGDGPGRIADAVLLARATTATIRGNIGWALACALPALPLAVLGYVSPLLAVIAAAASTLIVLANSLRLRRPGRTGQPGSAPPGSAPPGSAPPGRGGQAEGGQHDRAG